MTRKKGIGAWTAKGMLIFICSLLIAMGYGSLAMAATEQEGNNHPDYANLISVGVETYGRISNSDDLDYYQFSIDSAGYFNVTFKHEYIDSSFIYWNFSVYDSQQNLLFSRQSAGSNTIYNTAYIGVPAGTYYIRIASGSGWSSDAAYNLKVNYKEASNWEREGNDSFYRSDSISANTDVYGTIITSDDQDFYKVTIPYDGCISLTFKHEYVDSDRDYWRVRLYNESQYVYYDRLIRGSSTISNLPSVGVKAGTYYLRIEEGDFGWSSATYHFNLNYTVDSRWETEFNDSFSSADFIRTGNKIHGSLMMEDDEDFYQFNVVTPGKFRLDFEHQYTDSSSNYWNIVLYNAFNQEMANWHFRGNSSSTYAEGVSLAKGTYYIRIRPDYYYWSTPYSFKVTVKSQSAKKVTKINLNKTAESVVLGKTLRLSASISPSDAANKQVRWKSSNKNVATVSSNGLVRSKGYGTATITCTAKDGSGKKASCKITVCPGKGEFSNVRYSGTNDLGKF